MERYTKDGAHLKEVLASVVVLCTDSGKWILKDGVIE